MVQNQFVITQLKKKFIVYNLEPGIVIILTSVSDTTINVSLVLLTQNFWD